MFNSLPDLPGYLLREAFLGSVRKTLIVQEDGFDFGEPLVD